MISKLFLPFIASIAFIYFTIAYFMRLWIRLRFRMEHSNNPSEEHYGEALNMIEAHIIVASSITAAFLLVFFLWFLLGRSETQTLWGWLLGIDLGNYTF